MDAGDERRVLLKSHLAELAGLPPAPTRLVRAPARTEPQLAPPATAVAPAETPSRRIVIPVQVAKRFRRRGSHLHGAAGGESQARRISVPTDVSRRFKRRRPIVRVSPGGGGATTKKSPN
jgi:hypothetical protein